MAYDFPPDYVPPPPSVEMLEYDEWVNMLLGYDPDGTAFIDYLNRQMLTARNERLKNER